MILLIFLLNNSCFYFEENFSNVKNNSTELRFGMLEYNFRYFPHIKSESCLSLHNNFYRNNLFDSFDNFDFITNCSSADANHPLHSLTYNIDVNAISNESDSYNQLINLLEDLFLLFQKTVPVFFSLFLFMATIKIWKNFRFLQNLRNIILLLLKSMIKGITQNFKKITNFARLYSFDIFAKLIVFLLMITAFTFSLKIAMTLSNFFQTNQINFYCNNSGQMAETFYKQQRKIFLCGKAFERSSSSNSNYLSFLFLLVIQILKLKRNKKASCTGFYLINCILLISIFKFLCQSNDQSSPHRRLKNCSSYSFFSERSLDLVNDISDLQQQSYFYFLQLSKIKYKHHSLFLIYMLLLSNDITTNPGPTQNQNIFQSNNVWSPFQKRGLHISHLNINSLLPKIDEIRNFIDKAQPAVFGISESKLDDSISNSEIDINGYAIMRLDRNRHGGGIACYIKKEICFQIHDFISKDIEGIVFDILLPKTKPITVGIFYRPPDQYDFLEVLTNNLESIGYLNKEIILLGDFNINLLKNGKYIFENKSNQSDNSQTTLFKNYKEFCNSFSLKQLIKEATRIACNSPDSLLDHILTNSPQNVSQYGIIDLA